MKKNTLIALGAMVAVLIYVAPTPKEKTAELEATLKRVGELDVESQYYTLKELIEYKALKSKYNSKYKEYERLYALQNECEKQSRELRVNSLKYPMTYHETFKNGKWYNLEKYLVAFSFTGENLLGIKTEFKKNYVCEMGDGVSVRES